MKGKKRKKIDWADKEVEALIELWGNKEVLFNVQHSLYFNKNERRKALQHIQNDLSDQGINYEVQEIYDKMSKLRTYYGSQLRLTTTTQTKSGSGTEEVFVSKWKFFNSLIFLKDNLQPRKTKSNLSRAGPSEDETLTDNQPKTSNETAKFLY